MEIKIIYIIILIISAYLIGSFSSSYWYGKWFFNIDIRKEGSKNAGATNTMRVLGLRAAIPVFATDVIKSIISVQLVHLLPGIQDYSETFYLLKICLGTAAVVGHILPVYSNFDGGKGVASLLGVIIAVYPFGALMSMGIFIIVLVISRIISLSSLSAALSFPLFILLLEGTNKHSLLIFSIIATLLVFITHAKNIKRLLNGQEKKIVLAK